MGFLESSPPRPWEDDITMETIFKIKYPWIVDLPLLGMSCMNIFATCHFSIPKRNLTPQPQSVSFIPSLPPVGDPKTRNGGMTE